MFVLDKERTVRWPVEIQVPVDGGGTEKQEFEAFFKLGPIDENAREAVSIDKVRAATVGWSGVKEQTADGGTRDVVFSAAALDVMTRIPYARRGLILAYAACLAGAPRKNSERPPADGPAAGTPAPETKK